MNPIKSRFMWIYKDKKGTTGNKNLKKSDRMTSKSRESRQLRLLYADQGEL